MGLSIIELLPELPTVCGWVNLSTFGSVRAIMAYPLLSAVLERLDSARGHLPKVAEGSGVPVATVRKIAQRVSTDPGVKTVESLAAYFQISYMSQPASVTPDAGGSVVSSAAESP